MNAYHYYVIVAGMVAAYTLGVMHGRDHTHWKNTAVAFLGGALWPLTVLYGIYLAHFNQCAAELVEWQNKAVLRDGKVRELAAKCAEWAGERDSLKIAERMVERTALKACAVPTNA